jgi:nucleotide-binding universal stress UspA family protein
MSTTSTNGGLYRMLCIAVVAVAGLVTPASAMAEATRSEPVSPQRLELIERLAQHTTADVAATTPRGGSVDGQFNLDRIARRQGNLVALGTFRGTVEDPRLGAQTERAAQRATIPLGQVDQAKVAQQALCRVGEIRLDGTLLVELVGLHLTIRSLQIDLASDPESLLGNILCTLAGGAGTP